MSQGNNSQTPPSDVVPTSQVMPTASDIKKGLALPPTGGSPLDFINANLKPTVQSALPTSDVAHVADAVISGKESVEFTAPKVDAPITGELPKKEAKITADDLLNSVEKKKQTPEDSFKGLRKKAENLENTVKEKDTLLGQVTEELERYKKGEVLQDRAKELEAEVERLREYEHTVTLKTSPLHQKEYVEPIIAIKEEIASIAQEWEIPVDVIEEAISLDSKKKKHEYLCQYMDPATALETRELLDKYEDKLTKAKLAEEAPARTLSELKEKQALQSRVEEETRVNTIHSSAKNGWTKAFNKVQAERKFPELILDENSENYEYSRNVVNRSSEEFGKFVNMLTLLGAKDLPEEAAEIMALRFLTSEASLSATETRNAMYKEYKKVVDTTRENAIYDRPPSSGGMRSYPTSNGEAKKPTTLQEGVDNLLQSVLRK